MTKQTLVFESAVELSLNGEMILISDNARRHREHIKGIIPARCCDVSIILSPDNTGGGAFHSLSRKRTIRVNYGKPTDIEFF